MGDVIAKEIEEIEVIKEMREILTVSLRFSFRMWKMLIFWRESIFILT
jgi:hypothetical protein